jgi:hypothetical protein
MPDQQARPSPDCRAVLLQVSLASPPYIVPKRRIQVFPLNLKNKLA